MTKIWGANCRCAGNCTHDFYNAVEKDGAVVAWMFRSGGMREDEFFPSREEWRAAEERCVASRGAPGWQPA